DALPHLVTRWRSENGSEAGIAVTSIRKLTVTAQPINAARFAPVQEQLVATFTDQDFPNAVAGEYSVAIDWGDGTQSAGSITKAGNMFEVRASHTYGTAGQMRLEVTVEDAQGNVAVDARQIEVDPLDTQPN